MHIIAGQRRTWIPACVIKGIRMYDWLLDNAHFLLLVLCCTAVITIGLIGTAHLRGNEEGRGKPPFW